MGEITVHHFNNLTAAEDERLAMLAEECAEVIQVVAKIQRHGYHSYNPKDAYRRTNRMLLYQELTDVLATMRNLHEAGDVKMPTEMDIERERQSKREYVHHQN